jgi:hypothetical protein
MLMLLESSISLGATNCKVVEYPDHNEAICVGDEFAKPEAGSAVTASPATRVSNRAQNPVQSPPQTSNSGSPTVVAQQSVTPASTVSPQQTATPGTSTDKAAENMAIRRELATRNTQNLKNYSSAAAPLGK